MNGLSPRQCQAMIWTNAGILLIRNSGTNFNEILSETRTFSFKKIHLNMLYGKWRPFCLGLNLLTHWHHGCVHFSNSFQEWIPCAIPVKLPWSRWIPWDPIRVKRQHTMVWHCQATSHYLNQFNQVPSCHQTPMNWAKIIFRRSAIQWLLTLNMLGPSSSVLTRSISWLLMAWLIASPGHQHQWYRLCKIGRSLFSMRKDFYDLCHISMDEW